MGIYLSTPCTDIHSEDGKGNGIKFAVGEMQVKFYKKSQGT
jgi:hypothetical protein